MCSVMPVMISWNEFTLSEVVKIKVLLKSSDDYSFGINIKVLFVKVTRFEAVLREHCRLFN